MPYGYSILPLQLLESRASNRHPLMGQSLTSKREEQARCQRTLTIGQTFSEACTVDVLVPCSVSDQSDFQGVSVGLYNLGIGPA